MAFIFLTLNLALSWLLSFSLLARISLISAERTPAEELEVAPGSEPGDLLRVVRTETVRIERMDITKVISEKQPSFSRLPPPSKHPDRTPSGLFSRNRRETLNRNLRRGMMTRQDKLRRETGALFGSDGQPGHSPTDCRDEHLRQSQSQSRASRRVLAAVRTTNICLNFRNAQRLLVPMLSKQSSEASPSTRSGSCSFEEENDWDVSEFDSVAEGDEELDQVEPEEQAGEHLGEEEEEEEENASELFQLSLKNTSKEILKKTVFHDPHEKLQKESSKANYFLYADMMSEEESIDLLSSENSSVNAMREGVLDSLTTKRDLEQEQALWRDSKEAEWKLFEKSIEKNKDYIDEVVRMSNLKGQMLPSEEASHDYTIRWGESAVKNREVSKQSRKHDSVGAEEERVLRMLKLQETKQDKRSLQTLGRVSL